MAAGKLTGMAAFMGGKMKLTGNMALAQKFNTLIDAAKKAGPPAAAAAAPAAAQGPTGFQSLAVFEQIRANLAADPLLAKKVATPAHAHSPPPYADQKCTHTLTPTHNAERLGGLGVCVWAEFTLSRWDGWL